MPTLKSLVAERKIRRGEQFLQTLEARAGLTRCGKDWLIASLDPMHDTRLDNLEGWPDLETASSVVRCIKQSVTVATNQGASANWDCHVVQWPWLDSLNSKRWLRSGASGANRILDTPLGTFNAGGLQIYGMPADGDLDITAGGIAELTIDPEFSQGPGRVVGMGFEVVNTTAEISQQGLVTVYRQNQPHPFPTTFSTITAGGVVDVPFTGHLVVSPPVDTATALLIPGSRQWKAKEGCYVVQSFVGQDNPPLTVNYEAPIISTQDDDCASVNSSQVYAPATGLLGTTGQAGINVATKIYPIHMGGAIFTGLSASTTLTINWVVYYETFPNPSEQGILVLATPSAPYDPVALELFSHTLMKMPVGVPAIENAEGDWFDGLMTFIRDAAPIAAPILAGFNPAFGLAASAAGSMAGSYLTPPGAVARPPPLPARDASYVAAQRQLIRSEVKAEKNYKKRVKKKAKKRAARALAAEDRTVAKKMSQAEQRRLMNKLMREGY